MPTPSWLNLLPTSGPISNSVVREIYFRKPQWWARATWPLLLGVTVWSAVGAETAFNHWTRRSEAILDAAKENKDAVATHSQSSSSEAPQWELRPLYQRVLVSASILGFGIGLGTVFLSARSRIVRRLLAVSRPELAHGNTQLPQEFGNTIKQNVSFQYVLVETVANSRGKGKVFLKGKCELLPGRDDTEMLLKIPNARDFWLGLEGAMIEGTSVPGGVGPVRRRLLESWSGSSPADFSKKMGGRWISGPVVEGGS